MVIFICIVTVQQSFHPPILLLKLISRSLSPFSCPQTGIWAADEVASLQRLLARQSSGNDNESAKVVVRLPDNPELSDANVAGTGDNVDLDLLKNRELSNSQRGKGGSTSQGSSDGDVNNNGNSGVVLRSDECEAAHISIPLLGSEWRTPVFVVTAIDIVRYSAALLHS